jgi:putative (di)nucleoside polyphosphate hydrolase
VDFWYPLAHVVAFKREVYERALRHLAPLADQLRVATLGNGLDPKAAAG